MRKMLVILGASLFLAAGIFAAPGAGAKAPTVGDFMTSLASAIGERPVDLKAATEMLRDRGADVDLAMSAPLTHGAMARIATQLGMNITEPAAPGAPVTGVRMEAVAGYIGTALQERGVPTVSDIPTQCLSSVNRGACNACCKEATGLGGKFCGRFCHANVPPSPSPDEPQP